MANTTKQSKWHRWLFLLISLYGLHWLLVYGFSQAVFSECKQNNRKFSQRICSCKNDALRGTFVVENFIIDSLSEQPQSRYKATSHFLRIHNQCR